MEMQMRPMLLIIMELMMITHFINHVMELISAQTSNPACLNQVCGNIENINWPFSLAGNTDCPVISPFFSLTCDDVTQELYLFQNLEFHTVNYSEIAVQVISIQSDSLILNISEFNKVFLYNQTTCKKFPSPYAWRLFPPVGVGPYVLADDNIFGSFGSASGTLYTSNVVEKNGTDLYLSGGEAIGGCAIQLPDNANNSQCGYRNCCLTEMPVSSAVSFNGSNTTALSKPFSPRYFYVSVLASPFVDVPENMSFPCDQSYAALFHPNYTDFEFYFGVKVNWAIPFPADFKDMTDTAAIVEMTDYACAVNDTGGVNLTVLPEMNGYRCSCYPGYTGDGYANGTGCTDIRECDTSNKCIPQKATCQNLNGSFTCKCNSIFEEGDGRIDGSGCRISHTTINVISIGSGFIVLGLTTYIMIILLTWWRDKTRRRYFLHNGGLQLQEFMRSRGRETMRLFTESELSVATNNFSNLNIIGVGGFGSVFKGTLKDDRKVAIKKARHVDGDMQQFLNEMDILTQINHRHIVKVLGCCLETPTPLLVYEYVSNGSLADNLHRKRDGEIMTWVERLKVARQSADALAYLHGDISPPVFHRDVKPANILIDDKWNAKISDFGVSRLLLDGNEHVSTIVQGTLGYLDPEYFQTLQLTEKSDVYSFGVVLVELITCLKAVDNQNRPPEFCNLAILFIHHMKMGTLEEIIDPNLEVCDTLPSFMDAQIIRSSIMEVASIAYSCLAYEGSHRPTMRDVAIKLQYTFQSLINGFEIENEDAIPLLPPNRMFHGDPNIEYIQPESGSYSMSLDSLHVPNIPR